jgi:hypothetical protein
MALVRYRVRARRVKAGRYRYDLDAMNRSLFPGGWTAAEYDALREDLLRIAIALELETPFWEHEPGIPGHLRTLPPEPDVRLLATDRPGDRALFDLEQIAHTAILNGREAWLAEHDPIGEAEWTR